MLWFWLALFSGLCTSVTSTLRKNLANKVSILSVLWLPGLLSSPILLVLIFWQGIPIFTPILLLNIIFTIVIEAASYFMLIYSLKIEEISTVTLFLALAPVIGYFVNILLLGSSFQLIGFIGVLSIIMGLILVTIIKSDNRFKVKFSKGVILAILVCILWAFGTVSFVTGIRSSSVLFFVSIVNIFTILLFMTLDLFFLKNTFSFKKLFTKQNFFLSSFSLLSLFSELTALSMINQPAYVAAVRKVDIIANVIYGKVFLKEKKFQKK